MMRWRDFIRNASFRACWAWRPHVAHRTRGTDGRQKSSAELERKLRKEEFTLEDFRDQLKQIRKMGPLERLWTCCRRWTAAESSEGCKGGRGQLTRVEAIINSMTNQERRDHNVIDGKRRKRIAKGSGTTVQTSIRS